jgi:hypothetical protein
MGSEDEPSSFVCEGHAVVGGEELGFGLEQGMAIELVQRHDLQ